MKTFHNGRPLLRPDTMSDRGGVQPLTETQLAVKSIYVESLPPVIDFDCAGYAILENIPEEALQALSQVENSNSDDVQQNVSTIYIYTIFNIIFLKIYDTNSRVVKIFHDQDKNLHTQTIFSVWYCNICNLSFNTKKKNKIKLFFLTPVM